jgi:hypothetical protein
MVVLNTVRNKSHYIRGDNVGAHKVKWTLEYKIIKWEGDKPVKDTKLFDSFDDAYEYWRKKRGEVMYPPQNVPDWGAYLETFKIMPPKDNLTKKIIQRRNVDPSFGKRALRHPNRRPKK